MPKLTLSVNRETAASAKRYAKLRGTSVSKMVEAYLTEVVKPASAPAGDAPILRSIRGVLKKADLTEYRRHLAAKYK